MDVMLAHFEHDQVARLLVERSARQQQNFLPGTYLFQSITILAAPAVIKAAAFDIFFHCRRN